MDIDKLTVSSLFQRERRYLVPLFQRAYVWSVEGQCIPLWEDILEQVDALRHHHGAMEPRKHFLGAVVLSKASYSIGRSEALEVIDGQQRLTTLQVVLAAMRDVLHQTENSYINDELTRLTQNPRWSVDESDRFKVWPTNVDREDFRVVMTAGSRAAVENAYPPRLVRRKRQPDPPLVAAYLYFESAISEFVKVDTLDDSEPSARAIDNRKAEELFEAVVNHLRVIGILLSAEDDPQVIFETLNARGAPLEPADLIRNYVFRFASRNREDADGLYARYWRPYDTASNPEARGRRAEPRYWRVAEKQGRLKRGRLDLFLYHYLTYRSARDVRVTHLFQEFKSWWESPAGAGTGGQAAERELGRMFRASMVFQRLITPADDSRFDIFARRLNALDTSTVYPFVLWLAEQQENLLPGEFDGILQDLESYLIRRAICGFDTKNYNRTFLALVQASSRNPQDFSRAALREHLAALHGESVVWPNDAVFRAAFMIAPVYSNNWLGSTRTRMVLEALEYSLRTEKGESVPLPEWLWVEHIMPQSWSEANWPFSSGELDSEEEAQQRIERRNVAIHSFGNLTLLTGSLNIAVGNRGFRHKRDEILKNSRLQLNSHLYEMNGGWTETEIKHRGALLFEHARRIWPHPASATPSEMGVR